MGYISRDISGHSENFFCDFANKNINISNINDRTATIFLLIVDFVKIFNFNNKCWHLFCRKIKLLNFSLVFHNQISKWRFSKFHLCCSISSSSQLQSWLFFMISLINLRVNINKLLDFVNLSTIFFYSLFFQSFTPSLLQPKKEFMKKNQFCGKEW